MLQETGRHRASGYQDEADTGLVYSTEEVDGVWVDGAPRRVRPRLGIAVAVGLVAFVVIGLIWSTASGRFDSAEPAPTATDPNGDSAELYDPVNEPHPEASGSPLLSTPSGFDTPTGPPPPPAAVVSLTRPANQSGTAGTATSLQLSASDTRTAADLTFHATGLPGGLALNSSSGRITGTPNTPGRYPVRVWVSDNFGSSDSGSFVWTIAAPAHVCAAAQVLGNPGFETGSAAPWTSTLGVVDNTSTYPAHSGSWKARLGGQGQTATSHITQRVTIPGNCTTDTLSFWLRVDTSETVSHGHDRLWVRVLNAAGSSVLATLATYDNTDAGDYANWTFNVSAYAGQTIRIEFVAT